MNTNEIHSAITGLTARTPAPQELEYIRSSIGIDTHRYEIESVNALDRYPNDERIHAAIRAPHAHAEVAILAASPNWEDRIRAIAVRAALSRDITLPDSFPCIFEPAGTPNVAAWPRTSPFPWVVSPDEAMLRELLPLYRELWAAYENQWPHTPNRHFEVGRLDGLSPAQVYRPGTLPSDVIGTTMLVHDGMYARAPEHLRAMHPLHAQWEAANARTRAQVHAHQP